MIALDVPSKRATNECRSPKTRDVQRRAASTPARHADDLPRVPKTASPARPPLRESNEGARAEPASASKQPRRGLLGGVWSSALGN